MSKIEVKFDTKDFEKKLNKKLAPVRDMSPAMKACSIYLDRWVQRNFKTEGGNVGGWKRFALGGRPTADGGIDTSAKLLQDTGRLRSSFIPFYSKRNGGIKSDLHYAKTHQDGLGNVPQRRMLPKRKEVNDDLKRIFKSEIFKNV